MKTYKLNQWVKPIFSKASEDSWEILGTEDDFKQRFQLLYGKNPERLSKLFLERKYVGGNGTYGFSLTIF